MPGLGRRKKSCACASPNGSRAPASLSTSRAGRGAGGDEAPAGSPGGRRTRPAVSPPGPTFCQITTRVVVSAIRGPNRPGSPATRPGSRTNRSGAGALTSALVPGRGLTPRGLVFGRFRPSGARADFLSNTNPGSTRRDPRPEIARYEPGSTATGPVSRANRAVPGIPDTCVGSESRSNTTGVGIRQIPIRRRPAGRRPRS
jgi:hypothetical protein